jgi:class 3 adenylate cyclase
MIAGWAFHELGEVRLRMGDLDGADEAFRQAHELGRSPQPGLALVQLRRGKHEASVKAIGRALRDEADSQLDRAKLLPAQVEIALAVGDVDTARAAADELVEIAASFATPAMQAEASAARARVALSVGELVDAEEMAKRARRLWIEADITYEAARLGMLIGEIYTRGGDPEAALLEFGAAKSTFERIGAAPDMAAACARIDALSAAPAGRRVARTFLFSDIVKSTNLLEAIGDEAWMNLVAWHDATMRARFHAHNGDEVDHAGDGFFVAFETADAALGCATAIQQSLLAHRQAHGFAPSVRIGLHATDASEVDGTFRGKGVHVAARIGALAAGGEILLSSSTAECLAVPADLCDARQVALKGVTEQIEVASVAWDERRP